MKEASPLEELTLPESCGGRSAHTGECSYSGSCTCSLAAALPAAGASSSPPASAGSGGRDGAMEHQPPRGASQVEITWSRSVTWVGGRGDGVCLAPRASCLAGPGPHLKLLPEAGLGCVFRLLLLVQFQDPVLNVGRIHPRGIVGLRWARAKSQQFPDLRGLGI